MTKASKWRHARVLLTALLWLCCLVIGAGELNWNVKAGLVSADYSSTKLLPVLERIAIVTGWQVYLEPGAVSKTVSAKFKNLPPGEALRLLLGDLNFALVPNAGSKPRLYVFRTSRQSATQLLQPPGEEAAAKARAIKNELIVRLKPGVKIEDIARLVGAKVTGRIDGLNAYRLEFDDETATKLSKTLLGENSDVESVEENYLVDRPEVPLQVAGSSLPPPVLQLRPPPDSGQVIVGLVDTAVQSLGNNLDKFLLESLSLSGKASANPNEPTHGTSMAETILRALQNSTQGSTSVQILPVDIYGSNPSTSTFDVAAGLVAAINKGAKVVNLSLGSQADSAFLRDLIADAVSKDILIFAAKGNEPTKALVYPAAYDGVIAVTALERGKVAAYANQADIPTVGAPGTGVVHLNGNTFVTSGTSVSTATVSGLAAGHMEVGRKTPDQTRDFIQSELAVNTGATKPQ